MNGCSRPPPQSALHGSVSTTAYHCWLIALYPGSHRRSMMPMCGISAGRETPSLQESRNENSSFFSWLTFSHSFFWVWCGEATHSSKKYYTNHHIYISVLSSTVSLS
jgi:hypothetical protein